MHNRVVRRKGTKKSKKQKAKMKGLGPPGGRPKRPAKKASAAQKQKSAKKQTPEGSTPGQSAQSDGDVSSSEEEDGTGGSEEDGADGSELEWEPTQVLGETEELVWHVCTQCLFAMVICNLSLLVSVQVLLR
jgi:hypothetical protein